MPLQEAVADEAPDHCRGDLRRLTQAVDGDAARPAERLQGPTGTVGLSRVAATDDRSLLGAAPMRCAAADDAEPALADAA